MRRKEFLVENDAEVSQFLSEMTFGFLAQAPARKWFGAPGVPSLVPLNFVISNGHVCFHGSKIGEKMAYLRAGNRQAVFCVAREFAIIPSTYSEARIACPATAFFKSVVFRGTLEEVTDLQEKADALSAFMSKLQPEGGYAPFDLSDPEYLKNIKGTSVLRLRVKERTAKFKFGQNQTKAKWKMILDRLLEGRRPGDLETAGEMKKRCPFH